MWLERTIVGFLNRIAGPRAIAQAPGLRFGSLSETNAPVIWPTARRPEHLCVIGKTGSGKTHFFQILADQLMEGAEPWVFLDYHGDATDQIIRLASRHHSVADRLLVVDPSDLATSPGLNPLEPDRDDDSSAFRRSSELATILRQRWQVDAFGPRTEELLRNTLYVLAATGQTLVEAPTMLSSPEFRQHLLSQVTDTTSLDYWLNRFEPLSEPMKATFREPLLNKITGFLTDPACRHFLGQRVSTVNFSRAFDEGKWVLVCLPKGQLREHAHTLGNLVFARIQFDILARVRQRPTERRLVTIFCDEVQNLAENNLEVLLTEGRKFRCSIVTGHQHWAQTSPEMRSTLLSAGTHVFFRTSSADASILAPELSVAAKGRYQRELTQLPRGQAIARIGSGSPLTMTVPPLPRIHATDTAVTTLRKQATAAHARPRAAIETELQARRATPAPQAHTISPIAGHHETGQTSW